MSAGHLGIQWGCGGAAIVGGEEKDVAPELDKSQESAASPSCQYSPSGVLLAQQFSQVDQELHTRHQ